MARVRLPLVTGIGGVQAAAPTFSEVTGSYQGDPSISTPNGIKAGIPIGTPALGAVTVLVDVPDEDVTNGALDPQKIRQRYPDHFLVRNGFIK